MEIGNKVKNVVADNPMIMIGALVALVIVIIWLAMRGREKAVGKRTTKKSAAGAEDEIDELITKIHDKQKTRGAK